jgi:NAD(P)-dependent dehydrogenase (short-subunit alcohol dehydrogenase family)
MKNKICIITGTTSGIGKVTAKELARVGATVVMICRNKEKGNTLLNEIKTETGNQNTDLFIADLSSQKEVRRLAEEIKVKYPVIDVLVNNAGAINEKRTETIDNIETTFATNHLAPFLLTHLLLENIKAAPNGRIVNLASEAARMGKIYFSDLSLKKGYTPMKSYCQSKLANILFTMELCEHLKGTNITANCMHPGVVNTGFGKELKGLTKFFFLTLSSLLRKPEKGAETAIWLASSPAVEGITGKYFQDKKELKMQKHYTDMATAKRLWEVSAEMTGVK